MQLFSGLYTFHEIVTTVPFKGGMLKFCELMKLCVMSKVLGHCIFIYMRDHLSTILDNSQHGFLKGRSTATQLLSFYHNVGQSLDDGLQIDIVFLNLAKAFDSVSHKRFLLK